MQFAGKKGIALFILLVFTAIGIGFGSGLLVGRQFPAHHYERFGNSTYLLDSATGKVCDLGPLPAAQEAANRSDVSPQTTDFMRSLNPPNYPPPCGK